MNTLEIKVVGRDIAFLGLSFGITFTRVALGSLIAVALIANVQGVMPIAVVGTLVIMIADFFDGILFERSILSGSEHWRQRRRLADSIADRIIIHVVSLALVTVDVNFLPFYAFIFLREAVISGYCVYWYRKGFLIYPKFFAKLACTSIGLTGLAYLLVSEPIAALSVVLMLGLSACALFEYRKSLEDMVEAISPQR